MSQPAPSCYIFAGPTGHGLAPRLARRDGIRWLPPIRRDGVLQLASSGPPGNLAIVDGQFHQALAVGHAEIRLAMERGWKVWGLSSLGAIRAYEMRDLGMRGYGRVYQWFCDAGQAGGDFRDDEVALLHQPGTPYRPHTEPLIHLRMALKDLEQQGALTRRKSEQVLHELRSMWYGYRTLELFRRLVGRPVGDFTPYRIKTMDLRQFLEERPWEKSAEADEDDVAPGAAAAQR